jgi:hypothetical protein
MGWGFWAALLVGAIVEGCAFFALRRRGPFGRLIRVASLERVSVPAPAGSEAVRSRLAGEAWAQSPDPREKILGALAWTMNRVRKVGSVNRGDPAELLGAAEAGAGLGCRGMARLFSAALATVGIESRLVVLCRNILDGLDTHITVEVKWGGRFVVLDPTFHLAFAGAAGEYLSAQEIKAAVFLGRGEARPVFLGEVAYPARRERYYMDIRQCFDNCFVADEGSRCRALKLPPTLYWFGPRLYYEKLAQESVRHLELLNCCYAGVVVILPLLLLGGALWGML